MYVVVWKKKHIATPDEKNSNSILQLFREANLKLEFLFCF